MQQRASKQMTDLQSNVQRLQAVRKSVSFLSHFVVQSNLDRTILS